MKETLPSTESVVRIPSALESVLVRRIWELMFKAWTCPQGAQTVEVNGISSWMR